MFTGGRCGLVEGEIAILRECQSSEKLDAVLMKLSPDHKQWTVLLPLGNHRLDPIDRCLDLKTIRE